MPDGYECKRCKKSVEKDFRRVDNGEFTKYNHVVAFWINGQEEINTTLCPECREQLAEWIDPNLM